ncbi:MAG: MaoC/PaaZ C-terminal domain-containing protein [Myxococcota bacterium]|nr:MaoC/PaaZ C-terminal domain-containing protein [Myxococcota bacterium]
MSSGAAPAIGHRTVTKDAVAAFAGLTGDYARIHLDHHLGQASPYGRGFAHGLLSASWALGAMTLYAPERVGAGEPDAFVSGFRVMFRDVVRFGDTLSFECADASAPRSTAFSCRNQDGVAVTTGEVRVAQTRPSEGRREPPWPRARPEPPAAGSALTAEDLLERGPRGASRVRTLGEADVVGFVNFTGELNPLYIDTVFAERTLFGRRLAPPMLCFCLGFSSWLRELLRIPAEGSAQTAGHLGDRWEFVAPVFIGDTLEVRHKPLSVRRTRSQPKKGVMTYGLQLVNQREEVVQQGEVDMMLDMRDPH